MNKIKVARVFTGALFILVGLSAGVGLNFVRFDSTVIGAPNPPLTSVAHDTTMTGTGTTSSPIGIAHTGVGTGELANNAVISAKIANGAVTAPKFATTAAPIAGQMLGFSGTNLEWQTPEGGGGAQVVDHNGAKLGPYLEAGGYQSALMRINNLLFGVPVGPQGFSERGGQPILFQSTDCTGQAYFYYAAESVLIDTHNSVISNRMVYGSGAPQNITIQSYGYSLPVPTGQCSQFTSTGYFYPITEVDLTTLGFFAPFHVE